MIFLYASRNTDDIVEHHTRYSYMRQEIQTTSLSNIHDIRICVKKYRRHRWTLYTIFVYASRNSDDIVEQYTRYSYMRQEIQTTSLSTIHDIRICVENSDDFVEQYTRYKYMRRKYSSHFTMRAKILKFFRCCELWMHLTCVPAILCAR